MSWQLAAAFVILLLGALPIAIKLRRNLLERIDEYDRRHPPALPRLGSYNGWPVEYIGPAAFPDCRRESCMNTAPHRPGEGCIG